MIELSMVAAPATRERLQAMSQIGINSLVHYDMSNEPGKFDRFPKVVRAAAEAGLRVPVVESGPPVDSVIFGKAGAEAQLLEWVSVLPELARRGVEVVCYNFMPQVLADAMVVRTDYYAVTRGGALTTAFRASDLTADTVPHDEAAISPEAMWENLAHFLSVVIPVAEASGIRLAMHPDDPPLTPISGLNRIMSSVEDFERLLALSDSPANAITLCAGCFGELGECVPELAHRFAGRVAFSHFRNVRGSITDFIETFPDDGDVDLIGLFSVLDSARETIYVRADHSPSLATENGEQEHGYGFQGHLFTSGYMTGLLDTLRRNRVSP